MTPESTATRSCSPRMPPPEHAWFSGTRNKDSLGHGGAISHNVSCGMKISILVPLYNEEEFVATLLERVVAAPLPEGFAREIIVADDGSTDASVQEVEAVAEKYPGVIRLLTTTRNQGKGAALCRAIAEARGEFCIVQDADLEYN